MKIKGFHNNFAIAQALTFRTSYVVFPHRFWKRIPGAQKILTKIHRYGIIKISKIHKYIFGIYNDFL